jgi:hypothetical protein
MGAGILKKEETTMTWRWIHHNGERLRDVGVLADGSLHNPNGYDEAIVREAIRRAKEQEHECRSIAAKEAAITRRLRREKRVYEIAKRIVARERFGPRQNCVICGKGLTDSESITRGIGSDCWQDVLATISASRTCAEADDSPSPQKQLGLFADL